MHHESARLFPGEVCLLKPISAASESDEEDTPPEGEEDWLSDQDRALAERIAGQIKNWLNEGMMLQSQGRPLRPGDVMILVRKRGDLARLIVARLYEAGVPVAGVDRLRLQAPLGVQDGTRRILVRMDVARSMSWGSACPPVSISAVLEARH